MIVKSAEFPTHVTNLERNTAHRRFFVVDVEHLDAQYELIAGIERSGEIHAQSIGEIRASGADVQPTGPAPVVTQGTRSPNTNETIDPVLAPLDGWNRDRIDF